MQPSSGSMKVAIVFVLLFATVLCRPARKSYSESSDSSEEVVRRPARPAIRKQQLALPKSRSAPVQKVVAPAQSSSDESEDASDETQEAAAELPVQVKAAAAPADTSSVTSEDSDDSDDDDKEESDTEEEDSDSDSESGESSTPAPVTVTPTPGVVEPETTQEPIDPTIVTDPDAGRGDNLRGIIEDKSIIYVEEKSYPKGPNPYKSYEIVAKKVAYDMTNGNEVEKFPKVYKAFQVHSDIVEEDASTPEVETQGLDASSGLPQDQEVSARQAAVPAEDDSASSGASTANDSESSSTPEEEEEDASSPSDSASAESEDTQSSEEATATPGAADSDSDEDDSVESDSDEDGAGPNPTEMPEVVTAK